MGVPAIISEYGGQKMGQMLMDLVSDINPIQLNRASTAQSGPDIGGNVKAVRQLVKQNDANKGMTLGQYFEGKQIGAQIDPKGKTTFNKFVSEDRDKLRASTRAIGAAAIGSYALAPLVLGQDNPINRTVEAGAAFGMHAGITAAALRGGKTNMAAGMFGLGYGGLAAINAVRSGNNFGPF